MSSKSYPYSEYPFNFWDLATGRKLKSDPKFSAQTDSALDHQISNAFVSNNWRCGHFVSVRLFSYLNRISAYTKGWGDPCFNYDLTASAAIKISRQRPMMLVSAHSNALFAHHALILR